MKTILMTGAAGDLGTHLRRDLAGKYLLRLSDMRPVAPLAAGEKFVRGDLSKMADMLRVTKGVDAIVHLGGFSFEGPWEAILDANIVGCYNIFEAARRNGVRRVLFASSNHAAGFYKRDQPIDHRVYPKPDSRYGLSKVFGEQLGSLYADKYGLEVFCMRIGNVNVMPADKRRLSIWISPRDLAQLVSVGIENPNIKFEIVYGVSNNRRSWYDNSIRRTTPNVLRPRSWRRKNRLIRARKCTRAATSCLPSLGAIPAAFCLQEEKRERKGSPPQGKLARGRNWRRRRQRKGKQERGHQRNQKRRNESASPEARRSARHVRHAHAFL